MLEIQIVNNNPADTRSAFIDDPDTKEELDDIVSFIKDRISSGEKDTTELYSQLVDEIYKHGYTHHYVGLKIIRVE